MHIPMEALPGHNGSTEIATLDPQNATLERGTEDWFFRALTGDWDTSAGMRVNESTAMRIAAVWACVRNISEDIGKMPLNVYRNLKPRGREIVQNHPVHRLIHTAPNDVYGAMEFRQTLQAQALLWGNGYAEILRDGGGMPLEMYHIPAWKVSHAPQIRKDGSIFYEIWENPTRYIEIGNMFHIRGLGGDPYCGWSPIRTLRETLGIAIVAQESEGKLFGNGAVPSGVLQHPSTLKKEAKDYLRQSWHEMHGGANNFAKIAILEGGMTYSPMSMPFKDAQFIELRQFSIDEIARIFRVPPHKIMDLTHGTFSNIEEQNIEYVTDCLLSWAVRWEQEINRKLIPKRQADLYSKHVMQALLRGDTAKRQAFYTALFNIGMLSPNDGRELEELNPVEGGDTYFVQANVTPLEIAAEGPPEPPPMAPNPPPNQPKEEEMPENRRQSLIAVHADVLADVVGRVLRLAATRVGRAAGQAAGADKIEKFYVEHRVEVRVAFAPALIAFMASYRTAKGSDLWILACVDAYLAQSRAEMQSQDALKAWTNGERARVFAVAELTRIADWLDETKTAAA